MNMRQFWQKFQYDDSIGFTNKESYVPTCFRERHGRITTSSNTSWKRFKKKCKMESKRNGEFRVVFFLSDDNFFKAENMLDKYGW